MKKKLCSLCFLAMTFYGFAQTTSIPDANFEQALIDLGHDDVLDGSVLTENINTVTSLVINERGIEDLTGIEDFVALEELGLSYNKLTSLDVSNNTTLTSLFVNDNQITTLDVSNNTALIRLGIMRNKFTTIDVSALVNIEELFIHQNEITSVIFPSGSPLWKLHIYENQMSTLDVSSLTKLRDLRAWQNQLSSLDVSMLPNLDSFNANNNQLSRLNVANGNNSNFNYFDASNNPDLRCIQVDDVDYSIANWTLVDDPSIYGLDCSVTNIPDSNFEQALVDLGHDDVLDGVVLTVNISGLESLNVSEKNISDLTGIEDFTALTSLDCGYNLLTDLGVSNNLALESLYCDGNQLSVLDLSLNTGLVVLYCRFNLLKIFDVSANTKLTEFHCGSNQLSSLDVSSNPELRGFSCNSNQITNLNVGSNPDLYYFHFSNNMVTSLDVSSNPDLLYLYFQNNQISNIDLTANPKLQVLYCDNNQITNLDMSMHSELRVLGCSNNLLESLDLRNGNNTEMLTEYFTVLNNPNLTCIYVDDAVYSALNWSSNVDSTLAFVNDEAGCETLSLKELLAFKSEVYYNKVLESIKISSPLKITGVRLYSLSGQLLKTFKSNPETIQVGSLSAGVYIVQIDSEKGKEVKKIVKY